MTAMTSERTASTPASEPHFALLLACAWALVVAQLVAQHWGETARTLLDTDDAMRLAQLKDWLGGQGWYDLNQYRVASGYESHWSRLIDAGLAGTLRVFALFAGETLAERLMRTVWPMLWLLPTIGGAAAVAWRIARREAALVTLLLAAVGLPAFHQFTPGRIDHHNVQIALSVLAVAATVWSDRVRWTAWAAGAMTGLALAIGLECLPYLMVCAGAFAVRYAMDRDGAQAAARYGLALAAVSVAAFFAIVGPAHWTRGMCDALAINWVALVVAGGLGLAAAGRWFASERRAVRLACVAVIGTVAGGLFLAIQPACLRGPYAMMDAAVWPIWLADVREMQPLTTLMRTNPLAAVAIGAYPVAALLAALLLLRERARRFDAGYLAALAAFLVAFLTTLAAVKAYSYATWLGMPLVAAFALRLFALLKLHALVPRVAVGLLLTPAALSIGAIGVANAAGLSGQDDLIRPERAACFESGNYRALATLPPGLVAADLDFGPYLLALTPHRIVAAPYHRLSAGIMAAHDIFASAPDTARILAARLGVTYLVTCGPRPPNGVTDASLWSALHSGHVPGWLSLDPQMQGRFRVYRVRS
jgi:hypothetical protein